MAKKRTPAQRAADKRRPGRPPKLAEDKQNEQITVYLTKSERTRLEQLAEQEGLPLAALIMRPWREQEK